MCRGGEGGRLGTAEVSVSFRLSTLHASAAEGLLGLYLTFKIEKYQNVKHIRIPTVSKRKGNSREIISLDLELLLRGRAFWKGLRATEGEALLRLNCNTLGCSFAAIKSKH